MKTKPIILTLFLISALVSTAAAQSGGIDADTPYVTEQNAQRTTMPGAVNTRSQADSGLNSQVGMGSGINNQRLLNSGTTTAAVSGMDTRIRSTTFDQRDHVANSLQSQVDLIDQDIRSLRGQVMTPEIQRQIRQKQVQRDQLAQQQRRVRQSTPANWDAVRRGLQNDNSAGAAVQ